MIRNVDIAICTWNREELLEETLNSFKHLQIPTEVALRVLIVDNHSTDNTPGVIEDFANSEFASTHQVVPLVENVQGHTVARNRAVEAIAGDLVIWTDDDVIVSENWVNKYVDAANQHPEYGFFGSVIEPRFVGKQSKWISTNWDKLKGCFAARDLGSEWIEFSDQRLPYGANFAIRAEVQQKHRFNTSLGRSGEDVTGEDELELFRRILASGIRGCWVPGAPVQHQIPPQRASERYVFDYFVGQGKILAAKGENWNDDIHALNKEYRANFFWYKTKRLFASSHVWVSHMLRAALAKGQAEQLAGRE